MVTGQQPYLAFSIVKKARVDRREEKRREEKRRGE
jgi:hypothetical protein